MAAAPHLGRVRELMRTGTATAKAREEDKKHE